MYRLTIHIIFLSAFSIPVFSQQQDTVKTITSSSGPSEHFAVDSLARQENSPLDISATRGLYILTKDQKMQLRILGSVRFSALYDMVELPVKNTFNTYYIPTGSDNKKLPNYYNSLNQSRLGFEVNRKVDDKTVFIRLEMDFAGNNDQFRIRHAYGAVGNFLVGQTWSLFSNVSSLPSTVDKNGPTGSVTLRTSQARYSGKNKNGTRWATALEYSQPDLNFQGYDTAGLSTVQLIPDLTARIEREGVFGAVQLSMVITTISIKNRNNQVSSSFGLGGSISGTIDFTNKHRLLYQITYGRSISHFITTFSGTGTDAIFNPETGQIESLNSFGGFLSYGWNWTKKISSNISGGYADLSNKDFEPGESYRRSMSGSLDSFWDITDGARMGLEYVFGQRWNKDRSTGQASRFWVLFYYDF